MVKQTFKIEDILNQHKLEANFTSFGLPYFNPEKFKDTDLNSYSYDHFDKAQAKELQLTTTIELIYTSVFMKNGVRIQVNEIHPYPVDIYLNLQDKTINMVNYERENRHAESEWIRLDIYFDKTNTTLKDFDLYEISLETIEKDGIEQHHAVGLDGKLNDQYLDLLHKPSAQEASTSLNNLMSQFVADDLRVELTDMMLKAYKLGLGDS